MGPLQEVLNRGLVSGTGQSSATAPKEAQIPHAFDAQTRAVDNLEKLVDQLHTRLQSISRNQPTGVPENKKNPETIVPLAEAIYSHTDRINLIANYVAHMIDSLEI